jgi:hypothetical protein
MADRQTIAEVVDAKKNLDRVSRAIEMYHYMYDNGRHVRTVGTVNLTK